MPVAGSQPESDALKQGLVARSDEGACVVATVVLSAILRLRFRDEIRVSCRRLMGCASSKGALRGTALPIDTTGGTTRRDQGTAAGMALMQRTASLNGPAWRSAIIRPTWRSQ